MSRYRGVGAGLCFRGVHPPLPPSRTLGRMIRATFGENLFLYVGGTYDLLKVYDHIVAHFPHLVNTRLDRTLFQFQRAQEFVGYRVGF